MSTLKDYYNSTVAPAMMKKFGYQNVMQIPKLDKVVVNVAAGEAKDNAKVIDAIMNDLSLITGRSRLFAEQRSLLQTLSCGKACRSV